jgi:hypothetical protein
MMKSERKSEMLKRMKRWKRFRRLVGDIWRKGGIYFDKLSTTFKIYCIDSPSTSIPYSTIYAVFVLKIIAFLILTYSRECKIIEQAAICKTAVNA